MQEMQVWSLDWEDPLEDEMTTHSSILAWKIPWTEEPGGLQSVGSQRVRYNWDTHTVYLRYVNSQIIIQFKVSLSFGKSQELRVYNAMATHSSTLAWKIPWAEEPGGLQSMGWLGVGHDRATSLSLFTFMRWRRKWQPTPVFFPGESQGPGSLVGCRLWGRTELDPTEVT